MAYGGQNPYGGFVPNPDYSQFQSFEFYNSRMPQPGPPGRQPWVQEWDQNYGVVQGGSWTPANGPQQPPYHPQPSRVQRHQNQQPRQPNQQHQRQQQQQTNPRRNQPQNGQRPRGGQQRQPRQQQQDWPAPNEVSNGNAADVPETGSVDLDGPNMAGNGAISKKRTRPPKKNVPNETHRPGARWNRDGDRRAKPAYAPPPHAAPNPESAPEPLMSKKVSAEPTSPYVCPPKRESKFSNKPRDPQFKTQRELLMFNMINEKHECMVCFEVIRHKNPIWSCSHCFNIFHIWCIQKWCQSADDNSWRCPGCQRLYVEPPEKACFCGKTLQQAKDMKLKTYSSKHCCEEVCYKKRPKVGIWDCEHMCNELCHPGPCPPCEGMSLRKCCCGKKSVRVKCSNDSEILCDSSCDKLLSCGRHHCQNQCHSGPCDECTSTTELACRCGRKRDTVPCMDAPKGDLRDFSCNVECAEPLQCGNHKCQEVCHAGKCQPCPLLPEVNTYCLCGKVPQGALLLTPRKSCLDPVPQCPNKCNKQLPCDHTCPEKCHAGDCPACTLQSQTYCACKSSKKMVPCSVLAFDPVKCNRKCTKWLSCLRHKCHDTCCCRETHDCLQVCNKFLNCGRHRCDLLCHSDRCPPCLLASFDELRCECGTAVMYPPIPCGSKPPVCHKPCTRQHPCGHNSHNCHSEEECPPCTVPVKKVCMGNHKEVFPVLCNQEFVSCHQLCAKPLECGQHTCIKKCHGGPCLSEKCTQPCSKQRAECGHSCNVPCHGSDPCPNVKCTSELKVTCECKTKSEVRSCHQQFEAYKKKIQMEALVENMSEMLQGQRVTLPQAVPMAHWTTVIRLECGDECTVKQRQDRWFVGLQIVNPDLGQKLKLEYPVPLQRWVAQDKEFVKEVHQTLADLVAKTQKGPQRFRVHSFSVMNQAKRKFIHEYAPFFGLTSQSVDKRHSRSVDVSAEKNNCWLPSISLLEMVEKNFTHSSSKSSLTEMRKPAAPKFEEPAAGPSSAVLSYTQALAAKKN